MYELMFSPKTREWDPFAEMDKMLMREFGFKPEGRLARRNAFSNFATDVVEKNDHYELRCELAGFDKEDIKLELKDDVLTISAEHNDEKNEDQDDNYISRERFYGSYSRSFSLDGVDAENISAAYKNGVLTVKLPKQVIEEKKARSIDIL